MSDFIFSTAFQPHGRLSRIIESIYHHDTPLITEFHGRWGSLAVSDSQYDGFAPVETDQFLLIIVGGPILTRSSEPWDSGANSFHKCRLILDRMLGTHGVRWIDDLSGPFAILLIDKITLHFTIVTDLMSFIPVYESTTAAEKVFGTHVDMVARASSQEELDPVSVADFILNGVITYPHTMYSNVVQLLPATSHHFSGNRKCNERSTYWLPVEHNPYTSIDEAAEDLRAGVQSYIDRATESVNSVALFLSGGEDSRTVLGMLPERCDRHAYIFLDQMNREGRIAKAAANLYGARFCLETRTPGHYLNVLPACSDLVGMGTQYTHVYAYGLDSGRELKMFDAVFGGYSADTLLKGREVNKDPFFRRVPFCYERKSHTKLDREIGDALFDDSIRMSLKSRVDTHMKRVSDDVRKESTDEWFSIWPFSMRKTASLFWGNRRLFRSYEPFMCHVSVKVAAAVPQKWKLNRRLFQKMAQPALYRSKRLQHANGWLPYQPWQINQIITPIVRTSRRIQTGLGLRVGNQGPWNDWYKLLNSNDWKNFENNLVSKEATLPNIFKTPLRDILKTTSLNLKQRVNLVQILYQSERLG